MRRTPGDDDIQTENKIFLMRFFVVRRWPWRRWRRRRRCFVHRVRGQFSTMALWWCMMHLAFLIFSLSHSTYLWRRRCASHTRTKTHRDPFTIYFGWNYFRYWLLLLCSIRIRVCFEESNRNTKEENSFISGLAPLPTRQFRWLFYVFLCIGSFSSKVKECARKRDYYEIRKKIRCKVDLPAKNI